MRDESYIVWPSRDELLQRLLAVDADVYCRMFVYPRLLTHAGQRHTATGIAFIILYEICFALSDMPDELDAVLKAKIPALISAVVTEPALELEVQETNSETERDWDVFSRVTPRSGCRIKRVTTTGTEIRPCGRGNQFIHTGGPVCTTTLFPCPQELS